MDVGVAAPLLPAAVETMPIAVPDSEESATPLGKSGFWLGGAVAGPLIKDDVELAVSPTGGGSGVEYVDWLPGELLIVEFGLIGASSGGIQLKLVPTPVLVAAPPEKAPPGLIIALLPLVGWIAVPPVAAVGINAGGRWPTRDFTMMSPNCSGALRRPSVSSGHWKPRSPRLGGW
ncbi:MAG TPA: hypothetical protein VN641_19415, partial [Urbifossiella sp.]|nr:hypothetical protein [Urbifossiella sp.]